MDLYICMCIYMYVYIERDRQRDRDTEFYLEYLDELHRLHNNYPLALKKLEISCDMLSKY